ncbi:SusC/RagA family TonB-linked outer membrane protein [Pedobacter yulinensis]|uniref:SusC/RagA family TonB-linked outer membrane protein n=1 Tax=Pedobacter yulinensis TaxID=2126353 RepID=A0A2T3HHS5_9SPHI|nr:TonB-dependent receptor [Pedobacter yulinensis]PST81998.1 SusC/RagA family TonB-linked outer membrane protein [Pedobacter yulinensis]
MKIKILLSFLWMLLLYQPVAEAFQQPGALASRVAGRKSATSPAATDLNTAIELMFKRYKISIVSTQGGLQSFRIPADELKGGAATAILSFTTQLRELGFDLGKIDDRQFAIVRRTEPSIAKEAPARQVRVSGVVRNELAQGMPGVTVKVSRKQRNTITNTEGSYSIEVEPTDSLEFSYIGYKRQQIAVRNRVDLNVVLVPEEGSLEEVAIVGFGRQKRTSLVGAQVTLKPEELKLPVRDLTSAIAGRLAGVVAYQRGGAPGADGSDIFIRGIATFASSPQTPLLVVDGVPDRTINNIDPEDVESFTVLKDASATAIYGTRGANGVIIINTKKGKAGPPVLNAEFNNAISKFTRLPEFIDAPTFMTLYNEGLTMRGRTAQYTQDRIDKHASGADPDLYPNMNWYDELFNDFGNSKRATLNINGGSENAAYYISAGYYNEVGMFKRDEVQSYNSTLKLDRFNFTSNIDVNVTKTTKLAFGLNGFITNVNQPSYGVNSIFGLGTSTAPHVIPARYSNGQWPQLAGTLQSPVMALTQSGVTNSYNNSIRSNIKVTQDLGVLTKGLNVSAMFAFDVNINNNLTRARTLQTYWATGRDANGNLQTQITTAGTNALNFVLDRFGDRRFYSEASLNYSRKFGEHDLSGLLLFNQSDFSDATARVVPIGYKAAIPYRQRNFVGRATYGFRDRYFLEGNFSYSGSDNFVPSKRFGFFPSIGAGWIVSNEKFFENLKEVIPHFKLRYTYGVSGNAALSDPNFRFLYLTTIGEGGGYTFGEPGSTQGLTGYFESRIGGEVQWESSYRQNLGIELNFLKNDLQIIAELFKEDRRGILMPNFVIPYNSGFTTGNIPYNNIGKTANRGVDLTLNYTKNFTTENFFSFRGTFNYNQNLAVKDNLPPWRYDYLNRIGQPISQRFGYIATGLFQNQAEIDNAATQSGDIRPGDIRYKDLNGDGIINTNDQAAIGYGAVPRIIYGLNFGGGFKKFDISLFFQGAGLVDFNYAGGFGTTPFSQGSSYGNMYTQVLNRWTPTNPDPRPFYPRLSTNQDATTNYYTSTWWIQRADYLRLKSAELGYTFNPEFLKKIAMNRLRIYVNGTNLLTFSRWKFWDPELGDGNGASYPNITNYNIGLRANFK